MRIINHIYFQLTPEDTIDLTDGPAPDIEGELVLTVEPAPEAEEEEVVQPEVNAVVDRLIAVNTAVQEPVNDQICGTTELQPQPQPQTSKNTKRSIGI